ncbi:uncharacterized protein Pyn_29504 [Prunus yedoensis var. nudiflora]|uniref:Uncharacterized protein n=5 Tax=Prunus TaxID=3754 RepID=A0A314YCN7_PRUYE|nr:uncharacterized protein Pyn_29504 [Prunus yedoensis var. nudiflora]
MEKMMVNLKMKTLLDLVVERVADCKRWFFVEDAPNSFLTPENFYCMNFSLWSFEIMGRGRGKGKRLTVTNHDDPGSGEEEKIPAQKRRGRPQKPLKDEIDEEETEKIEADDSENGKAGIASKEIKSPSVAENGKKRKRYSQVKEKSDSVKEENGIGTRSSTDDSTKSNGFRHNGSRRKNKPRRAAEAGVECK